MRLAARGRNAGWGALPAIIGDFLDPLSSPSPDGCVCILLATAEDVPIRLPRGNLALQVQFHLQRAGLPRLTRIDDPDRTSEVFSLTFHQTFGTAW